LYKYSIACSAEADKVTFKSHDDEALIDESLQKRKSDEALMMLLFKKVTAMKC
jgi:hypothetical protein